MTIAIDKVRTGQQIRLLMEKRGVTVRDVKNALSLACVQSVYHWLDGQSMPTLDPYKNIPEGAERLFRYYRLIQECMAT